VFPPIVLGIIVYPLAGLTTDDFAFLKFLLILVLFNLTAASTCLLIGVLIQDSGVANLVGCLVMLFSLLFAGLFLNPDSMPAGTEWFEYLSIFHYAYEALAVNEVKYLTLTEKKFGLSIEVPGATILSTFGFDSGALWKDVIGLSVFFSIFLIGGYIAMHFVLVERR
jgi:ABC-type multidrug transport system permease subunit